MVFDLKIITIEHVVVEIDMFGENHFYEKSNVLMLINLVEMIYEYEQKMLDEDIVNVVYDIS